MVPVNLLAAFYCAVLGTGFALAISREAGVLSRDLLGNTQLLVLALALPLVLFAALMLVGGLRQALDRRHGFPATQFYSE